MYKNLARIGVACILSVAAGAVGAASMSVAFSPPNAGDGAAVNAVVSYSGVTAVGNGTQVVVCYDSSKLTYVSTTYANPPGETQPSADQAAGPLCVAPANRQVLLNYVSLGGTWPSNPAGSGTLAASGSLATIAFTTSTPFSGATVAVATENTAAGGDYGLGTANGTVTKTVTPSTAVFTIGNATVTEGGATANAVVTCTGSFASNTATPVNVAYSTTNAGGNFSVSGSSVAFTACGGQTQNIVVSPRADDSVVQGTVTGSILLGVVTTDVGSTVSATAGVVTVLDNDTPPVFSLGKAGACAEAATPTNCTFTITRDSGVATATTVNFTVAGTASRGVDYNLKNGGCAAGTVLSANSISHPNANPLVIDVCPIDDLLIETGGETVVLTLTANAPTYTVGTASQTQTIADDDSPQSVTIASSGSPAEAGTVAGTFTLTRTGGSTAAQALALTANLTLAGTATFGTSCAAGVDYQLAVVGPATASLSAAPRTVTFPASATTAAITLTPCDDLIIDTAETAILTIAAPTVTTDYTVGSPATATLTIADDDSPQVVTVAGPSGPIAEALGTGTFTFTRTGGSAAAQGLGLTVNIGRAGTATYGASCTAGVDYTSSVAGTTVTFSANVPTATVTVSACQDTLVDPAETIIYSVAPPTVTTDYTVGSPASATGTIADDEVGVSVSGNGATEGSPVSFVLTCTGPAASTATVTFAISGQDAGAVITPAPGPVTVTCGTPTTVTVSTTNDAIQGNARSVGITLTNPVAPAVLVGAGTASASVLDNDAPLGVPTMSMFGLGFMSLMLAGFVAFQRRRMQK